MTSMFRVRVEQVENTHCLLRLFIIHPDQKRFYATTSFALQILWDPTHPTYERSSPLGEAISVDEIGDPNYVIRNQDRFIKSVEFVEILNYPPKSRDSAMALDEVKFSSENEETLPQAVIRIGVSDARWLKHLTKGMEWETAAFNM